MRIDAEQCQSLVSHLQGFLPLAQCRISLSEPHDEVEPIDIIALSIGDTVATAPLFSIESGKHLGDIGRRLSVFLIVEIDAGLQPVKHMSEDMAVVLGTRIALLQFLHVAARLFQRLQHARDMMGLQFAENLVIVTLQQAVDPALGRERIVAGFGDGTAQLPKGVGKTAIVAQGMLHGTL